MVHGYWEVAWFIRVQTAGYPDRVPSAEKTSWSGTQNGSEWSAEISDYELTLSLRVDGKSYECRLEQQHLVGELVRMLKTARIRAEILASAAAVLEAGRTRRAPPPGGWVSIADCATCGAWPNSLREDLSTNGSATNERFPDGVSRLIGIRRNFGGRREVKRCPDCGTYYLLDNYYDWTPQGSDDVYFLTRLTPADALPLLPDDERAGLTAQWMRLMVGLARCCNSTRADIADYAKRSLAGKTTE